MIPNQSDQKEKAYKLAGELIDILFKLGYITKDFDLLTRVTWVNIRAGGTAFNDPEHIEAEKEALGKLKLILGEAVDIYVTEQLKKMADMAKMVERTMKKGNC